MNILMRYIALLLMMLAVASVGGRAAEGRAGKVYKVAIDAEYAPYEFVDVDGKVKGMLPDLLRAIGNSAHVTFEFLPMAWPDAVAALNAGRVDLVNMIRTPDRIGKYEFSEPHSRIHQALFRNAREREIRGVASLSGHRVALQQFDIAVEKLADRHGFERVMVSSKREGFLQLSSGKVAAFFSAEQPGLYLLHKYGFKNVDLAATGLFPQDYCFTAKKGNHAIIVLLNRELAQLKQSGRYDAIVKEWSIAPPGWLELHKEDVLVGIALLILLVVGFVLWSMQLRRQVRRQTRKLAEQAQEMAAVIEKSPNGILLLTEDGAIRSANPALCAMFGHGETELRRMTIHDLVPEQVRQRHVGLFADEVAGKSHQMMDQTRELRGLRQNGSEFPCDVTVSSFMVSGRRMISALVQDLTARKQAEQRQAEMRAKIEHTQRLESLGVLAGGIAHDFNNILTAILGNAAMAERKVLKNPQDTQRYLSNIVESSERAAELCKQMLAYSGKGKFVVKAIDLSAMVADIIRLLEVSIVKSVVLKYHLTEKLPAVEADAAQMQQVIMNLVINASDAIGNRSGVITISTGMMRVDSAYLAGTCLDDDLPEGRYVYLEVSDTGCGMDKATQDKVFEPFFTTKFTGHGLGMAAVLGIVRGHRGALKLYSELGRGTTFKMLLPASDQASQMLTAQVRPEQQWSGCGTVLIVDDEETVREAAAMMLEAMGFAILTAVDGEDGVRVYRQHQAKIVVVLMDMTMPRMDGKRCFTELRRINQDVRVVLSSGYNAQEATSQFAGQGLAGFLQKPYFPDTLQARMREILEK
ncbi:MAG: transporter substrate-binding domain-containing protein [Mariprofundales bacterium]|nr:transporter substrate-binding domain-containing protein [Mariprofundales bacterium]